MNIAELFQARASRHTGNDGIIAFRKRGSSVESSYAIEHISAAYAEKLQAAGLRTGDAVLVFYPMSVELYIALLAIFRLGLVAMFIDPSAGKEHIERCCELHPPQALIASTKAHWLRFVSPALRRIPRKFVIGLPVPGAKLLAWREPDWMTLPVLVAYLALIVGKYLVSPFTRRRRIVWVTGEEQRYAAEMQAEAVESLGQCSLQRKPIVAVADDHPALITFTSGSTGEPKAAVRTHGFLRAQHRVLEKSLALTPGEMDLTTLPIFVIANLASGVLSVIPAADLRFPGAIDPAPIVQQVGRLNLTSTAASPAFLERIADYCLQRQIRLTSWQKIFTGGAPVFPRLLDKLRCIAPNANVVAVYGSTEAEPIAKLRYEDIADEDRAAMLRGCGLLAGTPVPEIQLRVIADQWGTPIPPLTLAEFDKLQLAPHEPGEIVVTGEHVLTGYLHGRGDEETKFQVDGQVWHRTGDAGYLDERGRLWLLGRCAAKIEDARGNLYPFAVECAASHHPNVKRAALLQHDGQRLLLVELQPPRAGLNSLQKTLAWAALDEIRVIKKIPVDKRHNAKVDYPALMKLLS